MAFGIVEIVFSWLEMVFSALEIVFGIQKGISTVVKFCGKIGKNSPCFAIYYHYLSKITGNWLKR